MLPSPQFARTASPFVSGRFPPSLGLRCQCTAQMASTATETEEIPEVGGAFSSTLGLPVAKWGNRTSRSGVSIPFGSAYPSKDAIYLRRRRSMQTSRTMHMRMDRAGASRSRYWQLPSALAAHGCAVGHPTQYDAYASAPCPVIHQNCVSLLVLRWRVPVECRGWGAGNRRAWAFR